MILKWFQSLQLLLVSPKFLHSTYYYYYYYYYYNTLFHLRSLSPSCVHFIPIHRNMAVFCRICPLCFLALRPALSSSYVFTPPTPNLNQLRAVLMRRRYEIVYSQQQNSIQVGPTLPLWNNKLHTFITVFTTSHRP
jgi:hypothetical protein